MKELSRIAVTAGIISILQSAGLGLLPAAAASAVTGQKSIADSIALPAKFVTGLRLENCPIPAQPAAAIDKPWLRLSQSSDNPTIPGEGTPQRSQGSGTR